MTVLPVAVTVDHQVQCVVVDDAVEEEVEVEKEPRNLSSSSSDPPKWLPHHYANSSLLSYATQWKNQQLPHLQMKDHGYSKKRKITSTKPITVFGLAFGDSTCDHADGDQSNQRPGPYLIACTSHGEIVVWDMMYHQYSSPTKNGAARRNGPTPFRRSATPWSLIGHEDDNGDDKNHQDHDDIPRQRMQPEFAAPDLTNNINIRNEENQRNRPMLRLRLQYSDKYNKNENDIVLYHCHMTTIQNHSYYVVCGDHGVSVLDWHLDILPLLLTKGSTDNNDTTVTPQTIPFRHYRTYPTMLVRNNHYNNKTLWRGGHGMTTTTKTSPTYYAEVNHAIIVAANDGRRFLYGAANDAFGCYKWNFETGQIVATYTTTPGSNSLSHMNHACYTLTLFHNDTKTELLIGGDDGQLQIWDIETDQYLDAMNVNDMVIVTTKGNSVTSNSNNHVTHNKDQNRARSITTGSTVMNGSSSATPPQLWYISASTVWNEQWWIIGGGCHHCNSSPLPLPSYHGFIAIIHGMTRSVLSFITTRYKIQQLSLVTEYSTTSSDRSNSSEGQSLMALTNTNYMYRWTNPLALTNAATSQKVWCHTPSAYAMATTTIDPTNSMIAVGGVGSDIDIFLGDAQPYMKLSTNS